MSDTTISDAFDVAADAEAGRLFAADVIWMAQRMDLPINDPATEVRIANTRYTRLLRRYAGSLLDDLEKDVSDGKPAAAETGR